MSAFWENLFHGTSLNSCLHCISETYKTTLSLWNSLLYWCLPFWPKFRSFVQKLWLRSCSRCNSHHSFFLIWHNARKHLHSFTWSLSPQMFWEKLAPLTFGSNPVVWKIHLLLLVVAPFTLALDWFPAQLVTRLVIPESTKTTK